MQSNTCWCKAIGCIYKTDHIVIASALNAGDQSLTFADGARHKLRAGEAALLKLDEELGYEGI